MKWHETKQGWLMSLRKREDSCWGSVDEFYSEIESCENRGGVIESRGDVWGTLLPGSKPFLEKNDGIAFYHSSRAGFPKGDKWHRHPRISLIATIVQCDVNSRNPEGFLQFRVDKAVFDYMKKHPIVRDESTKDLLERCGVIPGPVATFYPVIRREWAEIIGLVRSGMLKEKSRKGKR